MATSPVFREVIDVSFDQAGFAASIVQLIEAWEKGLQEMSSKGIDTSGIGSIQIQQITEGLAQAKAELTAFANTVTDSFAQVATESAQSATQAAESQENAAARVSSAWTKAKAEQMNALNLLAQTNEQDAHAFYEAAQVALAAGVDFTKLDPSAQLRVMNQFTESLQNGTMDYEQLSAAQRNWYQNLAQVYGQAEQKTRESAQKQRLSYEEAWDAAIVEDQKWLQSRGKVMAQAEAMNEAYDAKRKKQAEQQQYQNSSFGSKLTSALTDEFEDIPGKIAQMAAYETAAVAVNAPLAVAQKTVQGIAGAFKDGFEYLTQLEDEAANLQGVLATNVTFASNTKDNFKEAGVAAKALHQEFENAAIQYGIGVDTITRGFKSFVDNGGASLTASVEDAAQVATLFAAALKAAGKDADATRSLLSEVPKLLDGTSSSSSKILQTLNISVAQWNAIVTQAKSQKDLLEQIQPLLQNYVTVAEESKDRFSSLREELDLIYKRVMSTFAQGLWDAFKDTLKDVEHGFEDNREAIEAFAKVISGTIKDALDMARALLSASPAESIFRTLAATIVEMATGLRQVFTVITGINVALKELEGIKTATSAKEAQAAWEDVGRTIHSVQKDLQENWEDGRDAVDRIMNPDKYRSASSPEVPSGVGTRTPSDNTKAHKERLTNIQQEYELAEKYLEEQYNKEKQSNESLFAERKISQQQLADRQKNIDEEQYQAQLGLIASYQRQARQYASTHNVSSETLTAFDSNLDTKGEQYRIQHDNAEFQQRKKSIEQYKALQDQFAEEAVAQTEKAGDAQLAILKAQGEKGLTLKSESYSQMIAVAQRMHDQERLYLEDELANAGADAQKRSAIQSKIAELDAKTTAQVLQYSEARKAALLSEYMTTQNAAVAAAKAQEAAAAQAINGHIRLGETSLEAAQRQEALAKAQLAVADATLAAKDAEILEAQALGMSVQEITKLKAQRDQLQASKDKAQTSVQRAEDQVQVTASPEAMLIKQTFTDFGSQLREGGNSFTKFGEGFDKTINDFATGINMFSADVDHIVSAFQQNFYSGLGEVAKDAGGIISTSFKDTFKDAGVIGGIVSAAGGLFSAIGSLFTARAREIAEDIAKEFKQTVEDLNLGQTTLSATITKLQQERADAISRLAGVKGGQDQLDKLLPEIDQEIAQLLQQQKTVLTNFQQSVQVLQAGGTELQSWTKSWMDINKQVQEYLDAGGDINTANAYLQAELNQMTADLRDKLADGEQTAIQDAIQLNSLIQQRIDLIKQEAETEYGIQTKDAIERRTSTAVQTASDLAKARADFNKQLDDLIDQISLTQQKVALESQVFDLAKSTADLQAESNALTLDSLKQQMEQYQEMLSIVKETSGYLFGGTFTGSIPGVSVPVATAGSGSTIFNSGAITLNVDASGQNVNSSQFAGYLADAIQSKVSSARTAF